MTLYILTPMLILAWAVYFATETRGTLPLIFLMVSTAIIYFRFRRELAKAAAANNVVAAAATYKYLADSEKERVHQYAVQIIRRSGWRGSDEPSFSDEAARYGWYALSLAELDIKPACLIGKWNFVKNPFVAISIRDSNIDSALHLARKQGFDIEISRASELDALLNKIEL